MKGKGFVFEMFCIVLCEDVRYLSGYLGYGFQHCLIV